MAVGITYTVFVYLSETQLRRSSGRRGRHAGYTNHRQAYSRPRLCRRLLSTAIGELIFQSNTFTLPKMFDDRLADLAISAEVVGRYAFAVFAFAAVGQLVVGYLLNRYSDRTVFAMVALLQAVLFGVMPGLSGLIVLVVATAFMLVVFGQIPIKDVLIQPCHTERMAKPGLRIKVYCDLFVSASSLPLIAWIHSRWGFDNLFGLLSVAAAFIFVSALLLPQALSSKRG